MRHTKTVASTLIVFTVIAGSYAGYSATAASRPSPSLGSPNQSKSSQGSKLPSGGSSPATKDTTSQESAASPTSPIVTVIRTESQASEAITWSNGLAITLVASYNPAHPIRKLGALPRPLHFVAVKFTLHNLGKTSISGNILRQASAVGTRFQLYPARPVRQLLECGDFNGGHYVLRAGTSMTGCATFAIPAGVAITKVMLAPEGPRSERGLWNLT